MQSISIIHNFNLIMTEKPLDLILSEIRSGLYCETIFALRRHIHYEQPDLYKILIRSLPTFTPSGIFRARGPLLLISKYSNYIMIDTGWITPMQIFIASKMLEDNPYTLAYFRSPSGKSLKIIVEVNSAWAYHNEVSIAVAKYYTEFLGLPIINADQDYSQLCYYSYDPVLYHNPQNEIFKIEITED